MNLLQEARIANCGAAAIRVRILVPADVRKHSLHFWSEVIVYFRKTKRLHAF